MVISEALLCIVQNVILFKMDHKIAKHNIFLNFAGYDVKDMGL